MLKKIEISTFLGILLVLLTTRLHAQNLNEIKKKAIGDQDIINFDETSSLFWNSNFRTGQGILRLNLVEYQTFETLDENKNPETHHAEVFDVFAGLQAGGVIYEGFMLVLEASLCNHQVKKKGADKFQNFRWGVSFETELSYGLSLSHQFTLVSKAAFRVWDNSTSNHPAAPEDVDIIDSNGFMLRLDIALYWEIFKIDNSHALNLLAGVGYHYYKVMEPNLNTEYTARGVDNTDMILGINFIAAGNLEVNFTVYFVGIFSIGLSFSYLS